MAQRKALGRGLSALLGTPEQESEELREVDINRILPNAQQPRKNFDEEALNELADSIRAHGVIQPIVVQPLPDSFFQIIAGERRWRASQRAGLLRIPAIIREVGAESSLEIALIENLQREDLNPIEEAQAFEKLIVDLGLTQEEVAIRVGKSRATVTNTLRLLRLPPEVQAWIGENKLSTGHAKALLSLPEPGAVPRGRDIAHGYQRIGGKVYDFTNVDSSMADAAGGNALLTSTEDLSRFLRAALSGRLFQRPETAAAMRTFLPTPNDHGRIGYGLGLERYVLPGGDEVIGHMGTGAGYRAFMFHLPAQNIDLSMIITSTADPSPVLFPALKVLLAAAS